MRFLIDRARSGLVATTLGGTAMDARRGTSIGLALLALLVGVPGTACAQRWSSIGPAGGGVYSVAIDPTTPATAYAASGSSVLKTTDGGATWSERLVGLPSSGTVTDITIDPGAHARVWMINQAQAGVFRSTDGTASWNRVSLFGQFYSIAFDPTDPDVVYLGESGRVFRSTDAGDHWSTLPVAGGLSVEEVVVVPSTPTTLYAAQFFGGVLVSTNAGQSWTAMNEGLADLRVFGLSMDPTAETTLYASTPNGIWKTTDGATSWTPTGLMTCQPGGRVAIDPTAPSTLYVPTSCGVFGSTDGGTTWVPRSGGLPAVYALDLAIDPQTPT